MSISLLLLLVSGGHCQLLLVEELGRYLRLGTTIDDAAGEAFDKAAKILGLGYPGGPALERAAAGGDAEAHRLPRPMKGRPGCDFSFSGLKTALRHRSPSIRRNAPISRQASRQRLSTASPTAPPMASPWRSRGAGDDAGGGRRCRRKQGAARAAGRGGRPGGLKLVAPPAKLCTDNAAMIAWAGIERLRKGLTDGLDFAPRPRWPLDEASAKPGARA